MSMYDQPTSYRNRRPSFSSGPSFGGQSFPPQNDFRRDGFSERGGQFGDSYSNGFPESFPQANSYGSFPPPGVMNTSYSMGNREQHHSPPFEPSGFDPTGGSFSRPATGYPDSYDNSPLSDNFIPPPMDDGFGARGRSHSIGGGGGFAPPALLPSALPMTPYPSHYSSKRSRRSSSVGPGMGMGMGMGMGVVGYGADPYRRHGGVNVKFRLKGGYRQGISLTEATDSARLSRSVTYSLHDLAPDARGRITLKVRWAGYRSLTYEIPVSQDYDGYVNLQSLVRRVARAIVHFMTSNHIALSWDRVVLHRLEEITPGIWIPVLTTH
jgi:hypothetical protein